MPLAAAVTHGNRISEEALATLLPREDGDFTGERAVSVGGQVLPWMGPASAPGARQREMHTRHREPNASACFLHLGGEIFADHAVLSPGRLRGLRHAGVRAAFASGGRGDAV